MMWSLFFVWSWSIPVAAVVGVFVLGGLWYSPWLFGNVWNREAGMNPKEKKMGHGAVVFGVSFVMGLISAAATFWTLRLYSMLFNAMSHAEHGWNTATYGPMPFVRTMSIAFVIGAVFVATSFTINYMFGGRSWKLLAIDASYHTLQFTAYGVVFALWN